MASWPEVPDGGGAVSAWGGEGQRPPGDRDGVSSFTIGAGGRGRRRAGADGPARLARLGLVVALAGLAASVAGVAVQVLPRSFTTAQQQQITAWEVSGRWRSWPAGRIFPPAVRYRLPGTALAAVTGLGLTAHRAGIAAQAACGRAADPAIARVLTLHHCRAVLRATYLDATGSTAVTVGIAVFADRAAEQAAARALPGDGRRGGTAFRPGIRPARLPGTPAARFRPGQRQLTWASSHGPYLVLAAAGYADGRPRVHEATDPYALTEMRSLVTGVAGAIGSALDAAPPPPRCPGTPGC